MQPPQKKVAATEHAPTTQAQLERELNPFSGIESDTAPCFLTKPRKPRTIVPILAFVAVMFLLAAGAVLYLLVETRKTRERNLDYLTILELSFEMVADMHTVLEWQDQCRKHTVLDDWRAAKAVGAVSDLCDVRFRDTETMQLNERNRFLLRHGINSKQWGDVFSKKYPERDLILDEVKQVVVSVCKAHASLMSKHLHKRFDDFGHEIKGQPLGVIEGEFNEYRLDYIRTHGSKMVDEVVTKVRNMNSKKKLWAKVQAGSE